MLIDRHQLIQMIPQDGGMCMLDGVASIDARRIICIASSHRDKANPLRRKGRLATVCGIEYAAQAMAAHGSWLDQISDKPKGGALALVREAMWTRPCLDDVLGDLEIEAEFNARDTRSAAYRFEIRAEDALLLSGQVTVVYAPGTP